MFQELQTAVADRLNADIFFLGPPRIEVLTEAKGDL